MTIIVLHQRPELARSLCYPHVQTCGSIIVTQGLIEFCAYRLKSLALVCYIPRKLHARALWRQHIVWIGFCSEFADATAQLWRIGSGQELRSYPPHVFIGLFGEEFGRILYREVRMRVLRGKTPCWPLNRGPPCMCCPKNVRTSLIERFWSDYHDWLLGIFLCFGLLVVSSATPLILRGISVVACMASAIYGFVMTCVLVGRRSDTALLQLLGHLSRLEQYWLLRLSGRDSG